MTLQDLGTFWQNSPIILLIWSFLCFALGFAFCGTMYYYRILRVINKAERLVDELRSQTFDDCPLVVKEERRSGDDRRN